MEQKKKTSCCCFAFFRRKSPKTSPKLVESQIKPPELLDVQPEQIRSFSSSQKLVSSHNFRSCIVTPARRTPNLQNMMNYKLNQSSDLNYTIETSISRPNTLKEVNKMNHSSPVKIQKELLRNELKIVTEEVLKGLDSNFLNKIAAKNPFFVKTPGPSPDFLSCPSVLESLGSLGVSPIKNEIYQEDNSDIESIFANTERFRRIPDIFIRGHQQIMPRLKPTTPVFCTMKKVLPQVRKENRLLFK